ncbi:uncharacterized protein LOC142229097 [Haematobia irritans]|uniref:uncharacterized protein LOC142229097 n=1 Tax=Haematobia irritans TaxID=7368 RepID=UPI003F50B342
MVLCKFFQLGTCRFGSKCHNEHFDVRQIIKNDVEAAINGKQWPLSTYGPFKDKPSIPNFIEDQMFEEVRMLCYEAKQKNFFQQFHEQFTKEVMEASNKMKTLLQMSPEVIDVVIKCYDAQAVGVENKSVQPANPFANSSANNIFGSSNQGGFTATTTNTNSGNIFGSTVNTNVATQNIFGGATTFNQPQQQSTIFGQPQQQQQQQQPTNNFFGNTNVQTNPSNIFGQIPQQQQPVFAAPQQQSASGFGLFAQAAQQSSLPIGQTQQSGGNIFGQATTQIFAETPSQQQLQQGPFGQTPIQQGTSQLMTCSQPVQQSQNLFGQPTNANTQQLNQVPPSQQQVTINAAIPSSSTIYSPMESLTSEEIEAFKADCFLPGKLPHNPPPRELIN